ncbi:hypothetical protein, partial [Runella sp.]|uniref:hypothetical protein n=1 Tax=Runella sp. TaxID=1960881 RepID=UPI0030171B76
MPNPFEIRCLLRQQTPMIHFQHEHPDATLRATELKAKLDKFIFKKLEKQYKEKADRDAFWAAHPHWKVGNGKSEHDALDYKLRVTPALSWTQPIEIPKVRDNQIDLDRNGKPKLDNYPGFFGNLGDEHEQETEKKFRFATEPIPVTIFCLHDDLRDYIKTHLPEFFYSHTFGTRQSKGFGAFKLVSLDGLEKLPVHMSIFRFQVTVNDQDLGRFIDQYGIRFPGKKIDRETAKEWLQQKQLFEHIELFHKSIRSGYNHQNPGYYQKSILFKYFRDPAQNIQWDKKSIKLSLFKRELDAQVSDYPKSDVLLFSDHTPDRLSTNGRRFLVRDLLGLASDSDWGKEFGNQKVEKTNEVIQRFKSP